MWKMLPEAWLSDKTSYRKISLKKVSNPRVNPSLPMSRWTGSSLFSIMDCRLFAPSHHIHPWWLIIHTTRNTLQRKISKEYEFSLTKLHWNCNFATIWSRGDELIHDDFIKWTHLPRYWPFAGNSPLIGKFSSQRPLTRSFDVFFDLRLNKQLSKQSWSWWFDSLRLQYYVIVMIPILFSPTEHSKYRPRTFVPFEIIPCDIWCDAEMVIEKLSVASFTREVDPQVAKRPLVFNERLTNP